jgi:nucleoid-associated protein YgaU
MQTQRVHRVQDGETLSSIAAIHFGNPHLWPALYRANRDQIRDPSRLYPGQTLSIPPSSSTLASGKGRRRARAADEPASR